jgi:hypothetical protein
MSLLFAWEKAHDLLIIEVRSFVDSCLVTNSEGDDDDILYDDYNDDNDDDDYNDDDDDDDYNDDDDYDDNYKLSDVD